ncbi:MAG TPA: alpha-2-macroglobulin family protein [Kofleriaceae bacterium]|nr:alpha-2-macroglobulin family protein [Kofleriaceae bacterium]
MLVACSVSDGAPAKPAPPPMGLASAAPQPLFTATEAAPPGSALRVVADDDELIGWIAGSTSFAGSIAKIELGGHVVSAMVGADNTFTLPVHVDKPTEAVVTAASMTERVTVPARAAHGTPVAYFIVDRSAYRPGDKLSFAAFLRELDGDVARPVANKPVEVRVVSDTKHTVVAKLPLVTDATGRITGEYTFSQADALDLYTLAIDGTAGTAKVELAEFRKPKVKLDVEPVVGDRSAELRFRGVDFLDRPVAGGRVSVTAQVVRDDTREQTLASGFALGTPWGLLDEAERRSLRAGELVRDAGALGPTVVSEVKGDVALDATGSATYRVPLRGEHLRGGHRLLVDATIVDSNGREQRATRTIPLARRDARIELATAHPLVAAGSKLEVRARVVDAAGRPLVATTTITALRAPVPAAGYAFESIGNYNNAYIGNAWSPNGGIVLQQPACFYTNSGCGPWYRGRRLRMSYAPPPATADALAATAVVHDDRADLTLDDPGAYRLVASARLADGSSVWSELGVAVRDPAAMPEVVIELDRDEVRHGERITGVIQSRYRDAAALVVVRDATGIRARRRIVLAGGLGKLDIPVGTQLGYGAAVEAYVLGNDHAIAATQELFRVVPTSKQLAITTTAKPSYGPGELVDLEVAVDRKEPVDLVVSVYDESLLGVAPDRSVDPVGFFHADQRLHARAGAATLAFELGDVTFGDIVERATQVAKRPVPDGDWTASTERNEAQQIVNSVRQDGYLSPALLAIVLRLAGVDARSIAGGWSYHIDNLKQLRRTRIAELVATIDGVVIQRVGDTLVFTDPNRQPASTASQGISFSGAASGNASFSFGGAGASYAVQLAAPPAPMALAIAANTTGDVVRRDFSDSAHWLVTRTGADGKARVQFRLPDSLTSWRVVVTAVARDLSVGRTTTQLRTLREVMIWPLLPRQLVEGDTLAIAGTVHNTSDTDRDIVVALRAQNVDVLTPAQLVVRVPRGGHVPVSWTVRAKEPGLATLAMSATSGVLADASEKRIPIVASAADQVVTASGFANRPLTVELPPGIDPKRATLELTLAPSLAADMVDTLDYLVEYPYGCAEQTMSRFAPAIRVAGVLGHLGLKDGRLTAKLPKIVDAGLKRLASLQQPDGGWAWNGHGETHEMITPYVVWGMLEAEKAGYKLSDDRTLRRGLERVRGLLEARLSDEHGLSDRTYLMYVYSQKQRVPDAWWNALLARRDKLTDYALGLAVQIAVLRGDHANAGKLVEALHTRVVRSDGGAYWRTGGFSRWMEDRYETPRSCSTRSSPTTRAIG